MYRLVQEHLATWLARRDEDPYRHVPTHAEHERRAYLECGILAHGGGFSLDLRLYRFRGYRTVRSLTQWNWDRRAYDVSV
ncbi:MAG: hypothetical protein FJY37_12260 [Betaproteobacteria bacterium]|nr:hypothetical protein [Betaproteobacteria bacterium]